MINASASSIRAWLECRRGWFLSSILRVPKLEPLYLRRGDALDAAVQRYLLDQPQPADLDQLVARQLQVVRKWLPPPGTASVQHSYQKRLAGVFLRGKADARRGGEWGHAGGVCIYDTKTTSDRGENRGAAEDRPAYAYTDEHTPGGNHRPLVNDIQAQLYAWFEFADDPKLQLVHVFWVYVNKDTAPKGWCVRATFHRDATFAWFRSTIAPILGEMVAYADRRGDIEYTDVPATLGPNGESCGLRCWVREHCAMFRGPNEYTAEEIDSSVNLITLRRNKEDPMGFNLDLLNEAEPVPAEAVSDLAQQLAQSVTNVIGDQLTSVAAELDAARETRALTGLQPTPVLGINPPRAAVSSSVLAAVQTGTYNPGSQFSGHLDDTLGPDLVVDPEPEPVVTQVVTPPPAAAPATTLRRRRGRPTNAERGLPPPKAEDTTGPTPSGSVVTPKPSDGIPPATTPAMVLVEELATAVQGLRDRADSVLSECNRVLRALRGDG